MFIDDPVFLVCTACGDGELQDKRPSFDSRYECVRCKRRGRTFTRPEPSVKSYRALKGSGAEDLSEAGALRRALERALELARWPAPKAELILRLFSRYPMRPSALYWACRVGGLGDCGARLIVMMVFGIPFGYPLP